MSADGDCAAISSIFPLLNIPTDSSCCTYNSEWIECDASPQRRITRVSIQHQNLNKPLPDILATLTEAIYIDLANNTFTASLPEIFDSFPKLQNLYLYNNSFTGLIPTSIGFAKALRSLYLGTAGLIGPIPSSLGDLVDLEEMHLQGNALTGWIPDTFGNLKKVHTILLDRGNKLTGPIPPSIAELPVLRDFAISDNLLTDNNICELFCELFSEFDGNCFEGGFGNVQVLYTPESVLPPTHFHCIYSLQHTLATFLNVFPFFKFEYLQRFFTRRGQLGT
ncbi:hypothetical protein HDV05_005370 [Chytridiales sp. JEL 0842]|nr:hypothetical protein HDV05_005370 [Chytridiales sp. JEL 0842]